MKALDFSGALQGYRVFFLGGGCWFMDLGC